MKAEKLAAAATALAASQSAANTSKIGAGSLASVGKQSMTNDVDDINKERTPSKALQVTSQIQSAPSTKGIHTFIMPDSMADIFGDYEP